MSSCKIAAVSLNQTPLDWQGNQQRIVAAIERAKAENIKILCFPELCITAYGCEDVFLGTGIYERALESVKDILKHCQGISVALGCPVRQKKKNYNCVFLISDAKLLGIYPKHVLANSGVYYEPRWFEPWPFGQREDFNFFGEIVPIGDHLFDVGGLKVAFEICEDAWTERRPIEQAAYAQADIVFNLSASHFAFSKFDQRVEIVKSSSKKFDVTYVYANAIGNESGRLIFDGGSLIARDGELIAVGERFSFKDTVFTTVDLKENSPSTQARSIDKNEAFARAVSLGLFDYMRKSKSRGFVVSLSGGADSSTTAILCAETIHLAVAELGADGFKRALSYLDLDHCEHPWEFVRELLTCVYQSTENSSEATFLASKALAEEISASFYKCDVEGIVQSYEGLVGNALGLELNWTEHDIALQNIQARVRGPLVWFFANLKGALLLATSNRSEAAVGYTTMDGDTCGGLSPIAGVDKAFLREWLKSIQVRPLLGLGVLGSLQFVNSLEPTAELRPADKHQTDESDLMPYSILDEIERLAIGKKLFEEEVLTQMLSKRPDVEHEQMAIWVSKFFKLWTRNQWKRERYAPSFHLDDENLDPKTWCRYPILSGAQ